MIDAIVLAAGRSRRMGTQKLLLPFDGRTVIRHVVDQVAAASPRRLLVVVGNDRVAIERAMSGTPATIVVNRDPEGDMLSSVRTGLSASSDDGQGILIVLGDQPSLQSEVILKLQAAFASSGRGIVVPAYEGQRGHPLLFSAGYRQELMTQYDDTGLRGLLEAHPDDVHEVEIPDSSILSDMDVPEDYERELKRLEDR
jgi:molybdenum cofactor cytidylyltransferase